MNAHNDVIRQLDELQADRDALVQRLRDTADRLEQSGDADPTPVRTALEKYREDFARLAQLLDLQDDADIATLQSRAADLSVLSSARATLANVAQLRRVDDHDMTPLSSLRNEAEQLGHRLAQVGHVSPEELSLARALQAGQHPWNALLTLVQQPDALDDVAWGQLVERVRETLGPDLTTAVIRGRLTVSNATPASV